ncbi:MAG: tetratricopeptide repeat protein, partial [Spirochaetota bacterium]
MIELSVPMTQWKRPTRRTLPLIVLLFLLMAASAGAGGASERSEDGDAGADASGQDVDYVAVAALMIRDGNYDRAEQALSEVDPTAEGVDLARYHTLLGLLELRDEDYEEAAGNFREAIRNGQEDPSIYAYLAQSQNALGNHQAALDALEELPNLTRFPGLFSLKASSEWELGRTADALATLRRAGELYPSRSDFARQRIAYLLELDLTQAAADESLSYLEDAEQNPEVYTSMGEALRRGGQLQAAVQVLELGRIRFPEDEQIMLVLAQTYLDREMPRTAGSIIEEAAARNFALYHEAAEIYRRAGDLSRA